MVILGVYPIFRLTQMMDPSRFGVIFKCHGRPASPSLDGLFLGGFNEAGVLQLRRQRVIHILQRLQQTPSGKGSPAWLPVGLDVGGWPVRNQTWQRKICHWEMGLSLKPPFRGNCIPGIASGLAHPTNNKWTNPYKSYQSCLWLGLLPTY